MPIRKICTRRVFDVELKKGESIIFTGGMDETKTANLLRMFNTQTRRRTSRTSFENCLKEAARQFVLKTYGPDRKQDRTDVVINYHWNGKGGRDTFIAIPGITMATGDIKSFRAVLDTMIRDQKGVFFPIGKPPVLSHAMTLLMPSFGFSGLCKNIISRSATKP